MKKRFITEPGLACDGGHTFAVTSLPTSSCAVVSYCQLLLKLMLANYDNVRCDMLEKVLKIRVGKVTSTS